MKRKRQEAALNAGSGVDFSDGQLKLKLKVLTLLHFTSFLKSVALLIS